MKILLWNSTETSPYITVSPNAISSGSKFTVCSSATTTFIPMFLVICDSGLATAQNTELTLSYNWDRHVPYSLVFLGSRPQLSLEILGCGLLRKDSGKVGRTSDQPPWVPQMGKSCVEWKDSH